ncbi:hypothetical protein Tco_1360391 [Tanacetum coccineum]
MASLKFVDQHNMVACLEKSEENTEFHQIVDFLSTCSINYALTVSPTIYASYIEQFWNTATSKTVNSVKQIHAIVNDRVVVISESSVRNDLLFDDEDGITCLTNDEIFENLALMGDYIETEDVVKEWRQSNETEELNKGSGGKGGNTKELVNTAVPKTVSTARPELSTARPELSTARPDVDAARQEDSMKEEKTKEKGVSIKDNEDSLRPARSILTLKPLLTIDRKDKGKIFLEEPEPAKKMTRSDFDAAQIAKDAEIAIQLQVNLQAEVERERQGEEEASKAAIAETYDEVKAGIDADALSAEIRSRPPTKSQLRNLMMYLKNMGGYKHSQLKSKTFSEIQDDAIKDSKEAAGVHKQKVLEEPNNTKVEIKQEGHEESMRKRSGRRLKMKATKKSKRQKTDVDLEEEEQLKAFLKIVPDEEGIIDYEVLEKRFPIINWESIYDFDRHGEKCIYYKIIRSNGSSRWIKTFSEMVTRFDRLDLVELYNLVMKRLETTTPEGVDLVLWGDLRTMFDANSEDELWKNQKRWNLKSWDLYENFGVHTLILEDAGTASEDAYTLLRFIQKQIDEYGSHDGGEKDL